MSAPHRPCTIVSLAVMLASMVPGTTRAADDSPPVMLPPLIIETNAYVPPWRYARTKQFEVLSCCEDKTTRRLSDLIAESYNALGALLPPRFLPQSSGRDTFILFSDAHLSRKDDHMVGTVVESARPPGTVAHAAPSAISRNDWAAFAPLVQQDAPSPAPAQIGRPVEFYRHAQFVDEEATSTFIIVSGRSLDPGNWRLSASSVRDLLEKRVPQFPHWFLAGFHTILLQTHLRKGTWTLSPMVWPGNGRPESDALVPLAEFFPMLSRDFTDLDGELAERAFAQRELLIRWAIDPAGTDHQEGFWTLLDQACRDHLTAESAGTCFGANLETIDAELRAYLPRATRATVRWKPRKARSPNHMPDLREATPTEIARIQGGWERLASIYVRAHLAEAVDAYYQHAHRTLEKGISENEPPDGRILAELGRLEYDAGNLSDARSHLEAAFATGPITPAASTLLARLRWRELLSGTSDAGAKFHPSSLAPVFQCLRTAEGNQPTLPETLQLRAEAWQRSAEPPTRQVLSELADGAAAFQRNPDVAIAVARLLAGNGESARARELIASSLAHVGQPRARRALQEIAAQYSLEIEDPGDQ